MTPVRLIGTTFLTLVVGCSSRDPSQHPDTAHATRADGARVPVIAATRDTAGDVGDVGHPELIPPSFSSPDSLPQLPVIVRHALTARACRVVQSRGNRQSNVVHGDFYATGTDDWAVLCTGGENGVILVFRSGDEKVDELESVGGRLPRLDQPPSHGEPTGWCVPAIERLGAESMSALVAAGVIVRGSQPDTLITSERTHLRLHDGLISANCEGTSNVYYFTGKRWVRFPGAD